MTSAHGARARRFRVAGARPIDTGNPPTQHGRHRLRRRLRVGPLNGPRRAALWPFGDAEPLPDATKLAGWLGRTIIALVTGYTRPGDRVLLLAPPPPPEGSSGRITARSGDPYAGLGEAVWAITRLGRTADSADAVEGHPADAADPGSQSGSGPGLQWLGLRPPTGPDDDPTRGVRKVANRFALIVTAVHPQTSPRTASGGDWRALTAWRDLMTDSATLAVITHSDHWGARLIDPVPSLVNTMSSQSLGWHDHIAVLDRPITPAGRNGDEPTVEPSNPSVPSTPVRYLPVRRAHHDVLLFTPGPQPNCVPNADVPSATETDAGRGDIR